MPTEEDLKGHAYLLRNVLNLAEGLMRPDPIASRIRLKSSHPSAMMSQLMVPPYIRRVCVNSAISPVLYSVNDRQFRIRGVSLIPNSQDNPNTASDCPCESA